MSDKVELSEFFWVFAIIAWVFLAAGYFLGAFTLWDFGWLGGIGTWEPPARVLFAIALFGLLAIAFYLAIDVMRWDRQRSAKRDSVS